MIVRERKFKGVFEIEFKPFEDHRGFFMRVYDEKGFAKEGIHRNWVQENHSLSLKKGTIRGIHFQFPPHAEAKIVRVITGEIFDVFVDLRRGSPTFGQWDSLVLSGENKKAVFIPQGFGHGFCTLTDQVHVVYKVDAAYAPGHEGALRWDDPTLAIPWPVKQPILSEKDKNAKGFKEFIQAHQGLQV